MMEMTMTEMTMTEMTMEELRKTLWNGRMMRPTAVSQTLTKLMLRSCGLEGTLCHEIDCMPHLEMLDVGENRLSGLPFTIGGCVALTTVLADNNTLSKLPNSLGLLPRLETLDLAFNPDLASLPPAVCRLVEAECNVVLEGTPWVPSESREREDDVEVVKADLDAMGLGWWTVSGVERITLGESPASVFRVSTEEEGEVILKRVGAGEGAESLSEEKMEKARAELDAEADVLASGLFETPEGTVPVPSLLGHVPSRVLCTSVVGSKEAIPASDFATRGVAAQRTVVTSLAAFLANLHSLPCPQQSEGPRLVLSHGDACLPNFLVSPEGDVEGMCDLGRAEFLPPSSDVDDISWSISYNLGSRWLSLFNSTYTRLLAPCSSPSPSP